MGLARIPLRRLAVKAARPRPLPEAPTRRGEAQPCDPAVWSAGLWGVFLPDRREAQAGLPSGFADRRRPSTSATSTAS